MSFFLRRLIQLIWSLEQLRLLRFGANVKARIFRASIIEYKPRMLSRPCRQMGILARDQILAWQLALEDRSCGGLCSPPTSMMRPTAHRPLG
jgi:hypothetical protein